jgi:alanine dehydrogenase
VANIPGAVPNTSTIALTNATQKYVLDLADKGWKQACIEDKALAKGVNMIEGVCTYHPVAKVWNIKYMPITEFL